MLAYAQIFFLRTCTYVNIIYSYSICIDKHIQCSRAQKDVIAAERAQVAAKEENGESQVCARAYLGLWVYDEYVDCVWYV